MKMGIYPIKFSHSGNTEQRVQPGIVASSHDHDSTGPCNPKGLFNRAIGFSNDIEIMRREMVGERPRRRASFTVDITTGMAGSSPDPAIQVRPAATVLSDEIAPTAASTSTSSDIGSRHIARVDTESGLRSTHPSQAAESATSTVQISTASSSSNRDTPPRLPLKWYDVIIVFWSFAAIQILLAVEIGTDVGGVGGLLGFIIVVTYLYSTIFRVLADINKVRKSKIYQL